MPLEIRELHIKVNVNDTPSAGAAQPSPGAAGKDDHKEQLLRDCIDEVMQVLHNTKER